MSLVKLNPYNSAVAGKEFRLNIAGMTDRKIFFTILGDDAPVVQEYIDATNEQFIEENGIVDRTADQKLDFLQGRFALQVIAVRTEMLDGKKTTQAKI